MNNSGEGIDIKKNSKRKEITKWRNRTFKRNAIRCNKTNLKNN